MQNNNYVAKYSAMFNRASVVPSAFEYDRNKKMDDDIFLDVSSEDIEYFNMSRRNADDTFSDVSSAMSFSY